MSVTVCLLCIPCPLSHNTHHLCFQISLQPLWFFSLKSKFYIENESQRFSICSFIVQKTRTGWAEPIQTQEPRMSLRFLMWVQSPKALNHSSLLSQTTKREQDGKWGKNPQPYGMSSVLTGGLAHCATALSLFVFPFHSKASDAY